MSIDTAPTVSATALDATSGIAARRDILRRLLMTLGPILVALVIAGCILLAVASIHSPIMAMFWRRGCSRRSASSRP
ncbi:hypothetical protein [Mesorhizobium amorphae]|uniref:hypothetical protein n=1 Tax=Mesorhizobium amorphae TaxID=71433 RepID=UPI0021B2CEF0|nr:hypothetical protein [Mesorhizobium amorphae]